MGFLSICVSLYLLYFQVSTDKGLTVATRPLSSPFSSSSSYSSSPPSLVIQKTTSKKGCSDCVLVSEEALQNLLQVTNTTIKDLQPQEPDESTDHVGDEVPHLPSMEGLSSGSESLSQRLLRDLWAAEAIIQQLEKDINKQKEESSTCKEELKREMEEKDQAMRDCHPNPHHRHPGHRYRLHHPHPPSSLGAHSLSMTSGSTAILRSDLQDIKESILDELTDIRNNGILCNKKEPKRQKQGWPPKKSCYDLFKSGGKRESGVYTIYPFNGSFEAQGVSVWCDMGEEDDGEGKEVGWTVFLQRRQLPQPVLFDRSWEDYRDGFGDPHTEYWIGNEVLHQLTTLGKPQALRIDMEDFDGVHKFASYGMFSVGSEEDNYRLTVGMFSSSSTVSWDALRYHNGATFSTRERDNDRSPDNCVAEHGGGGGFWMGSCHNTAPTAPIRGKGKSAYEMHYGGFKPGGPTTLKEMSWKIKPSG